MATKSTLMVVWLSLRVCVCMKRGYGTFCCNCHLHLHHLHFFQIIPFCTCSDVPSGDKPSLRDCQKFGIVLKMASEWYTFGVYLGLEDDVDNVDANYRLVQDKCARVITLWLNGNGKKHSKDPITWQTLHAAVEMIYPAFAEELLANIIE